MHTPVQYELCTVRYNYTRRDGTTNTATLQSRNGTKIGTVHDIAACTVPPGCRVAVRDAFYDVGSLVAQVSTGVYQFFTISSSATSLEYRSGNEDCVTGRDVQFSDIVVL